MPLYKDNEIFIERVLKGDIELKRVYKGNEIVGGIYEVIFHDRDIPTKGEEDYQPKKYVWGVKYEIMPELDDYFDEFKTHYDGGYEDNQFLVAIPYITKNFHRDLNLYAKWLQRKYSYNGTIKYGTVEVISHDTRNQAPEPWDDPYDWNDSTWICMPNCTGYVKGRTVEAGADNPPVYNQPEAENGNNPNNIQDNGEFIDSSSGGGAGDVLYFGSQNHVAFVEGDGQISESVYTYGGYNPPFTLYRSGHTAADVYSQCEPYWDADCYRAGGGTGGGKLRTRYWHKDGNSAFVSMGYITGYLHYNGTGHGDSEEVGSDHTSPAVGKRECEDQDNPDFPDANEIYPGEVSPSGDYRDSTGKTTIKYTDLRSYDYENSRGGTGTPESTDNGLFG